MVYTNLNAASGSIKTAKQCLELSSGRAMLGMCVKGGTNWKKEKNKREVNKLFYKSKQWEYTIKCD